MNATASHSHTQRLTAAERQLLALAWRLAHTAARAAAASVLGHGDEALDDIAASAAAHTLAHSDAVLTEETVLGGRTLGRLAAAGRRAALDERRARSGRRSGSQRRCDPLQRADRLPMEAALGSPADRIPRCC